MKFGIGDLHWKLMERFHFGLYQLNVNPTLHEAKLRICQFVKKQFIIQKKIADIDFINNYNFYFKHTSCTEYLLKSKEVVCNFCLCLVWIALQQ
jgi:hypothetical protein